MDIGRAFAFVFEDADWLKKILIGGLISLIPIIGGFVTYGYALEVLRRSYAQTGDELPEWDDFGGYLTRGFLLWLGILIWFLPVILVFACIAIVLTIGSGSGDDAVAVFTGVAAVGLMGLIFLLVAAWMAVFLPVVAGRYAVEQRFGTMFEFGAIIAEVRRAGAVPLLILFVTVLVASFVGQLGFILCFIGVIFTGFYSYLVMAHGAGQVYRRARGLDDAAATSSRPTAF